MLIKIDNRERNLIELVEKKISTSKNEYNNNIKINVEQLDLGDIIIYDDNTNEELLIIERKTIHDLSSSIKDGRYSEQSFRLMNTNIHNHNILYLIEGNIDSFKITKNYNNIHHNTIYSSIVSLSFIKGFSVFKTNNLDETAHYILRIAYKLSINNKPLYYKNINQNIIQNNNNQKNENIEQNIEQNINNNETELKSEYCNVIKRNKKSNITNENIGIIMLMQIPQVSYNSAKAIMDKYNNNFKSLLDDLSNNTKCLNDIKYKSKYKNSFTYRNINKTTITNIFSYLIVNNNIILS